MGQPVTNAVAPHGTPRGRRFAQPRG